MLKQGKEKRDLDDRVLWKTKIRLSLFQTSMGYILLDVKQSRAPNMHRVCVRDLYHFSSCNSCRLLYIFGSVNLYDIVASAPLAFTTPSPEFCAGIATG
jgi:hypothetical protein